MKLIIATLLLILPSISYAQSFNTEDFSGEKKKGTPVTEAQAKIYYSTCASNRDERMNTDTQNTFCQCTAFGYKEHITQEDLQELANGTSEEKRTIINKMVIDLYAPCMEFPIRDMVYNKCTTDAYQAGKQICSCMANRMATYISKRAKVELKNILKENPHIYDPLQAITSSKSYAKQEKIIVLQCIQGK